jgi:hypothetical protein
MKTIINPITGKKIFVGGPTYKKLKQDPKFSAEVAKRVANAKNVGTRVSKKFVLRRSNPLKTLHIKKSKTLSLRKKLDKSGVRLSRSGPIRLSQVKKLPGSSSLGKYTKKDGPFCGPAGGAAPMTYPVGTKKRAVNAVSRSVNAPNPEGIRKCATKYAVKKHWITKEDKKRLLVANKK